MKISSKAYWLMGAALSSYFCFAYFKRPPHADSEQNKAHVHEAAEPSPSKSPVEPAKVVTAGEPHSPETPDEFSGAELLPKLGSVLSDSMLEALQKTGSPPELQAAALESGGKTYGLGIHSGGGLVLQLGRDNALLMFGFVSNAGDASSAKEQHLLKEFALVEQPIVTVLDEKFEGVEMQVQRFESKVSPKTHALAFVQGQLRSLVFFDSTRVEMKKLLPASPDTMDPTMLKHLRSLLAPPK